MVFFENPFGRLFTRLFFCGTIEMKKQKSNQEVRRGEEKS